MNINIDDIKEDLHGKKVSILVGEAQDVVLENAIILPFDESSFSIFNDKAVVKEKGDVFRLNLRDIEMIEKYNENGIVYNIKCKRSGFYTVSVLDKVS